MDELSRWYYKLLRRAHEEGYPVGVREEMQIEHALTDWEAAAFIPSRKVDRDVTTGAIEWARSNVNRLFGPVVQAVGHRNGMETWGLVPEKKNREPESPSSPDKQQTLWTAGAT